MLGESLLWYSGGDQGVPFGTGNRDTADVLYSQIMGAALRPSMDKE